MLAPSHLAHQLDFYVEIEVGHISYMASVPIVTKVYQGNFYFRCHVFNTMYILLPMIKWENNFCHTVIECYYYDV